MRFFRRKIVEETIERINDNWVYSPVKGKLKSLSEIDDEVFSSGMMGDGIIVEPVDKTIVAPVSGRIAAVFETKHAIAIESNSGCEVLIHIGIDTVELKGKYFDIGVKVGDRVEAGNLIGNVQFEEIKKNGYRTDVIVVITNSDNYIVEKIPKENFIDKKEPLLNISKKGK